MSESFYISYSAADPQHNNGMQRTRASAPLSYTLRGRSPLMPGVMLLLTARYRKQF